MHHPPSRAIVGMVLCLTIAACGGSAATEGSDPASVGEGPTPVAETTAPEGGGGTADACALLTVDEVSAATGQPGIEAQPTADSETDATSTCGFVSNGVLPVVIISILDPANTNTDASSYLGLPGSVEAPVNGARAIFVPAAGNVMFVVKGTTVATFLVAAPAEGDDFQTAATKLVQKVADRMP